MSPTEVAAKALRDVKISEFESRQHKPWVALALAQAVFESIDRDDLARVISASVGGWNKDTAAIQRTADAVLAWLRGEGR